MTEAENPPAFPGLSQTPGYGCSRRNEISGEWEEWSQGMTLRDYFAAKAMQGMCAISDHEFSHAAPEKIAGWAYQQADAMLKARGDGGK